MSKQPGFVAAIASALRNAPLPLTGTAAGAEGAQAAVASVAPSVERAKLAPPAASPGYVADLLDD